MAFYAGIFEDCRVVDVMRCGEAGPGPAGSVLAVTFELAGQRLMALNGGPMYRFTPAISLFVACRDQAELDHYWDRLVEGGAPQRCGWLTDRFGVTWQVVPVRLQALLSDPDAAAAKRAMAAMMGMVKLDLAGLERAFAGG